MGFDAFSKKFEAYFSREIAEQAAKSISDGAEIGFTINSDGDRPEESFVFTKTNGKHRIIPGPAKTPDIVFSLTPAAAEEIVNDPSSDIGTIGINILRLVISTDPKRKVSMKVRTGFIGLYSKGYLGVLSVGGAAFASFLASHGLNGIGAIKSVLKNLKS